MHGGDGDRDRRLAARGEREGKQEEDAPETLMDDDEREDGGRPGHEAPSSPPPPPSATGTVRIELGGSRTLVGLELPVYAPTMTEAVLETVGGLRNLQQTHEAKSQFLPVKLRPREPSCKPLFADLTKTQTILLRLRRTKRRKLAVTETTEDGSVPSRLPLARENGHDGRRGRPTENGHGRDADAIYRFDGEIVGLVREKYVCEGMADFQYFTNRQFFPTPDATRTSTSTSPNGASTAATIAAAATTAVAVSAVAPTSMTALLDPSHSSPAGVVAEPPGLTPPTTLPTYVGSAAQAAIQASLRPYLRVQDERCLEMIPEVFSKVDLPLKYEFRQRSGYQPTETAKKPSTTMTYLNFHDDVPAPAAPRPENPVMRRRPVGAHENVDEEVLRVLQDKLAEKPIWLRPKLFVGLDFMERRAARRILRRLCYVFVDGPWRGSWIRMGYDPRKTPDSARFQVLELRNNRELVHAKVTHPSRKRTKKYSGINPKGPRIAKVTQTSEHENAQADKRRRKERFLRGETRRSFLVDPTGPVPPGSPDPSVISTASGGTEKHVDWDSENDGEDLMDEDGGGESTSWRQAGDGERPPTSGATTSTAAPGGSPDRTYEIFGVPLTSANVLFQLDEIEDDEARDWIAQFQRQANPTLLGGWYSTHMFLPLREIIRYRIAALVGRSKAELETRRKRIEALKKQALSDYADQLAGREPSSSKKAKQKQATPDKPTGDGADVEVIVEDQMLDEAQALEVTLARTRATESPQSATLKAGGRSRIRDKPNEMSRASVPTDGDDGGRVDAEDELEGDPEDEGEEEDDDIDGEEDVEAAKGRLNKVVQEGDEEDDDEDEDEDDDANDMDVDDNRTEGSPENGVAAAQASTNDSDTHTAPSTEYSF